MLVAPSSASVAHLVAGGELTGDTDLHFDELNTFDILYVLDRCCFASCSLL
jgi:hypothetical protein